MSEPFDPCGLRDVLREAKLIKVRHAEVDVQPLIDAVAALDLLIESTDRHADLAKHLLALGQEFARGHGTERDESGHSKLGGMATELAAELDLYEESTR